MYRIAVRESSCSRERARALGAESTDAALGTSLLLLRCNLKSTYEGNLARFYVLELRDAAPKASPPIDEGGRRKKIATRVAPITHTVGRRLIIGVAISAIDP